MPPPVTLTAFPGLWANTRKRFRLELKVRLSISSLLNYAFYCTGSEPVKQDWFARKNGHPDRMPKGSEYERLDRENVLNHFQSYFNAKCAKKLLPIY